MTTQKISKAKNAKPSKIFSVNNGKLKDLGLRIGKRVVSFDLPAGHTCPAASLCKSQVELTESGYKVKDYGVFRCYAASTEGMYPNTRELRNRNLELTKTENFVSIMSEELNRIGAEVVRIHSSGDFYHVKYMRLWVEVAKRNPHIQFFGYTKMLPFLKELNQLPNMKFVYSIGGTQDSKIQNLETVWNMHIPTCTVVTDDILNSFPHKITCEEVVSDDYEAIMSGESFGIRLHGTQAKKA